MSVPAFITIFFVGAAVLALWVDVRFGERAPKELSRIVLHMIAALFAWRLARMGFRNFADPGEAPQMMLLLFGLLLPTLIYVFLTTLWVLRMIRGLMPR